MKLKEGSLDTVHYYNRNGGFWGEKHIGVLDDQELMVLAETLDNLSLAQVIGHLGKHTLVAQAKGFPRAKETKAKTKTKAKASSKTET